MLTRIFTADGDAIDSQMSVVALLIGSINRCIYGRLRQRERSEVQAQLTDLEANGVDTVRA